ncbi:hypothetical protein [Granulicella aggregans]|uniref:hypothetical protein n=1 Tax=Granulicella aggregans TaxID=474949 RepID=UPI003D7C164E
MALNQKVKKLIQKLGEAIHESVSESENIAGVVKNIREQGFDVLLMLEATIGLNEVEEEDAATVESADESAEGPFTKNDLSFLRSLRISLSENEGEVEAGPNQLPPPGSSDASATGERSAN